MQNILDIDVVFLLHDFPYVSDIMFVYQILGGKYRMLNYLYPSAKKICSLLPLYHIIIKRTNTSHVMDY